MAALQKARSYAHDVESCPREPPSPLSLIYGFKTAGAHLKKQTGPVLPADTQTTSWHFCMSMPLIAESGILMSLSLQGQGWINAPSNTISIVQDHFGDATDLSLNMHLPIADSNQFRSEAVHEV